MMGAAPYIGVLVGMVCCWLYLQRTIVPVSASGWRSTKVSAGDCPEEHCGGSTYMVAAEAHATMWRCEKCRKAWLLAAVPRD